MKGKGKKYSLQPLKLYNEGGRKPACSGTENHGLESTCSGTVLMIYSAHAQQHWLTAGERKPVPCGFK